MVASRGRLRTSPRVPSSPCWTRRITERKKLGSSNLGDATRSWPWSDFIVALRLRSVLPPGAGSDYTATGVPRQPRSDIAGCFECPREEVRSAPLDREDDHVGDRLAV